MYKFHTPTDIRKSDVGRRVPDYDDADDARKLRSDSQFVAQMNLFRIRNNICTRKSRDLKN